MRAPTNPLTLVALLGLLASAWSGACSPAAPPPRPPVVLIVLDSLRTTRLGGYGAARDTSPNIDGLARHSLVFEHASSTAPWTTPAVAAIFTGNHPGVLGIEAQPVVIPASMPTLPEALRAEGYQTFGVVSHIYVGEKLGFARGFDRWDQSNARGHRYVSSRAVTDVALETLAARDSARPFFLFVHYFDAHYDYIEHPGHAFSSSYTGKLRQSLPMDELRRQVQAGELGDADLRHLRDVYDSEVHFADHHIGRLLKELEAQGLYDGSLIVLTADHGEALGDHEWIGHSRSLYQELLRTPLLIKLPGNRTESVVEASVSTLDIFPTLVDYLQLSVPSLPDPAERSLLKVQGDRIAFGETRNKATLQSVTRGPWKLIHDTESGEQLLFDLEADPGETQDRSAEHPELVAELDLLRRSWSERNESLRRLLSVEAPDLSEAEIEQLRLLGYTR